MSEAGRRRVRTAVLGWALLYARQGNDWSAVDRGPYDAHCGRLLAGRIGAETLDRIGTVLAAQPADNPLRQDAYRRAERHVAPRYRCVYEVR